MTNGEQLTGECSGAGVIRRSTLAEFIRVALPRGVALFIGGFSLLNSLGGFRSAGLDANLWWIDLRFLPQSFARALLLVAALFLVGFGLRPPRLLWWRFLTFGWALVLGLVCLANSAQFYVLLAHGEVSPGIPVPLSLPIAAALAMIAADCWRSRGHARDSMKFVPVLAVWCACAVGFPIAQMFCFGKTDYRRPADVAVVLGARVYADGRPSDALADRVRTACQLYRDGLAGKLIFSGGPGDGAVHETESMKRMAVALGVNADDILLDAAGLNTGATVQNTGRIFSRLHASRVLVVSHFYHLPRIKLAYQRAGWEVFTVPARERHWLYLHPSNLLREVAALWVYYLRPIV